MEPVLPFNPVMKVDHPQLVAMMQAYGEQYYANADFLNQMIVNNNYLFELFQVAQGRRIVKLVPETTYLVIADDFDKLLVFTNPLPVAVHVSADLDFNIYALQKGNGQISFAGNTGVTVTPPVDSYPKTENKGAVVGLLRIAANDFNLIGKLQLI